MVSDPENKELHEIINNHILAEIRSKGTATFKPVLISIVQERPDLKGAIRTQVQYIKQKIEEFNAKKEEIDPDIPSDLEIDESEMNEYEELSTLFAKKIESEPDIKKYVKTLLCYGSYGKGSHLVGQSDINFLIILENIDDDKKRNYVLEDINEAIEEIMNPLFVHLFDLTILFDRDIQNLDKIGTAFNKVHAFSSKEGITLIGENPFANWDFDAESLKPEAKNILVDTIAEFAENFDQMNWDSQVKIEDLLYLSSEAIVNVGISLCYFYGTNKFENVTKTELKEFFKNIARKNAHLKPFERLVYDSWEYRIGISTKNLDRSYIKKCVEFCQHLEKKLS